MRLLIEYHVRMPGRARVHQVFDEEKERISQKSQHPVLYIPKPSCRSIYVRASCVECRSGWEWDRVLQRGRVSSGAAQVPCPTKQAIACHVGSYRVEPFFSSPTPQPLLGPLADSDGGSMYMQTMVLSSPLMVSTPMLLVIRSVSPSTCPAPLPTTLATSCLYLPSRLPCSNQPPPPSPSHLFFSVPSLSR